MSVAKIAVDLILIAILVGGVAYGILFTVNQSDWDTQTILIWGFLGVVGAAALILQLLKDAGVKIEL